MLGGNPLIGSNPKSLEVFEEVFYMHCKMKQVFF